MKIVNLKINNYFFAIITVAFFAGIFFSLSAHAAAPTNGLVGYWNFNEGSGTTAADSSGGGNNGTLVNGPTWITGKVGSGAVSFGGNDYVDTGSTVLSNPSHTGTFATWVKWNALDVYTTLLSNGSMGGSEANGVNFYLAPVSGTHLLGSLNNGTTNHKTITGNTMLTTGVWYHTVFTWDGSNLYLYLNGVSDATPVAQTFDPTPAYNFTIGWDGEHVSGAQANATIDEARVYIGRCRHRKSKGYINWENDPDRYKRCEMRCKIINKFLTNDKFNV